jgi:Na+/melibiose symporter-like transporter
MPFLAVGTVGLSLFSFLIFTPPHIGESWMNVAWLAVMVSFFYLFLTVYTMPYAALLSELAHTPAERLNLATINSVTWALGFAVGNQIYLFKGLLEPQVMAMGITPELAPLRAFQFTLGAFAILSAILMALPVLFIRERDYCKSHVSHMSTWECVISTLRNKSFLFFVLSDFAYWVAMTIIQSTVAYYVTILIGLPEEVTSNMLLVMFITSFLFYAPVNLLAKRFGQKRILIFAFATFSLVFASVFFLGSGMPLSPNAQVYGIAVLSAIPIAIFGILPSSLIADIADADGFKTGEYRAGMFFATRTLGMKLGTALATLIIPTLLVYGKSPENTIGVRLTGIVAFVFCVVGLLLLLKVDEESVLKTISEECASEELEPPAPSQNS